MYDQAAAQQTSRLSILLRAVEVWLVISVVEVIHGAARIALLQPLVGDFPARQIAVFSGSVLIVATTFIFRNWLQATSLRDCLFVGLTWVFLTLGFEFALGKLILDLSWERILSDYNLLEGGMMPIGLVVMLVSPVLVSRLSEFNQ